MANFQVRFDQTLLGQTIYNVTNWQFTSDSLAVKQEFADVMRSMWGTNLAEHMVSDWQLQSLTYRQMDGGGPFTELVTFTSGPLSGTNVSSALAPQLALLVSLGYLGSKPNRGRIYFAGFGEQANTAAGNVVSTVLGDFEAVVEAWADGVTLTGGAAFLRIARPNYTTNVWTLNNPVESVIARAVWATQRRRRKGVGI